MQNQHRQLAAILFTDIVGYTALMQENERKAVALIKHYNVALNQIVGLHNGKVLNNYGDGSLCTFPSVTEALNSAIELQKELQSEPNVPLRIGLHVGEVFFEDEKVLGDGVNVASRIQSLGQANTILFSKEILDKIRNQPEFKSVSLGLFTFKNVDGPIEVFALTNEDLVIPDKKKIEGKLLERKSPRKKIILISSLILLVLVSFIVYRQFFKPTNSGEKGKSLAILPFKEIGSGADSMGEGLVEDVLVHLSKISELTKVISNRSSSKFANSTKTPAEIGEELNVNTLGIGSIQHVGDTIVVSVQLIDSKSGNMLWADKYTKANTQIFDLETELATQIVSALKGKLTPQEKKGLSKRYTENIEAYKFYRKGRWFWNAEGRQNFDSAEANFKRAIQLEPDYALAYAGLADCYAINFRNLSPLDLVPIAKIYVEKALSLDSTLSEAFTTLGFIQQNFDFEWLKAKKNLRKAIDLDPNNYVAHMYYGLVLMHSTPDKEGALHEFKKAVDLNPLSYRTNWILSHNYYFAGEYDLAMEQFKKTASFASRGTQYVPIWSIGLIYLKKKLYPQAKVQFDQLPEIPESLYDNYPILKSYAYAVMGEKAKALALLEKTLKQYPNLTNHYRNSQVYVALGNFDEAINELELAYTNRETQMFWTKVDPEFDPIRNEPGFKALMKKMNLD